MRKLFALAAFLTMSSVSLASYESCTADKGEATDAYNTASSAYTDATANGNAAHSFDTLPATAPSSWSMQDRTTYNNASSSFEYYESLGDSDVSAGYGRWLSDTASSPMGRSCSHWISVADTYYNNGSYDLAESDYEDAIIAGNQAITDFNDAYSAYASAISAGNTCQTIWNKYNP